MINQLIPKNIDEVTKEVKQFINENNLKFLVSLIKLWKQQLLV